MGRTRPPRATVVAYARVYLDIADDPKFATVYDDNDLLATWLRLLLGAEGAFPASPAVPRRVDQEALDALAAAGLVDLLPGDRYRIHGLEAERVRRVERFRKAADARWDKEREQGAEGADADASVDAMHMQRMYDAPRAEPRQDETSRAPRAAARAAAPAGAPAPARETAPGPTRLADLLPPPPGHRRRP